MAQCTGYLTIYSADKNEIYGEFAAAEWKVEQTPGGMNNVFSGLAGEGALSTFQRLDDSGVSHVVYTFETNGDKYEGSAQLLAPVETGRLGETLIRIESGDIPV